VGSLTWQAVALGLGVLAGVAYLGQAHIITGDTAGNIYLAFAAGGVVGHFTTSGKGGP
jgi:hypothetical protein